MYGKDIQRAVEFSIEEEKELQRKKRNIDNSTETSGGYSILEEIKFNDQAHLN